MIPQEIIRKKRDKINLNKEDIKTFVKGLIDNSFSDPQIASMSMAIFLNGMSKEEIILMTEAMTCSGNKLNWENILDNNLVCDKHSTGGVGDKVSLLLAPILAACGMFVPMVSGRGLGHTGGTLDKFDSIPGYNTKPDVELFQKIVKNVGCAIIGQTSDLAPADKKLYSIRDVVSTVESIPLITSSILSKKIASGLSSLVLDVKVGNGSFNESIEIGQKLAQSLVDVAKGSGLRCEAILTDMNQVLGWNAGHALEVKECVEYLTNIKKNKRLETVTIKLAESVLVMTKKIDNAKARKEIDQAVRSGKAAEKFEKMISALGGSNNFLSNYNSQLVSSKYTNDIFSDQSGFVKSINTRKLGLILIELGGGRKQIQDKIDFSIGFEKVLTVGSYVNSSTPLLKLHASSKNDFERIKTTVQKCFEISENETESLDTIYQTIN